MTESLETAIDSGSDSLDDHDVSFEDSEEVEYSVGELSGYYYELELLLGRVESAATHYQVLGVDCLATTGEISTAYTLSAIWLAPETHGLDLPLPEALEPRVRQAWTRVSEAVQVLLNHEKRTAYDGRLFGWGQTESRIRKQRQERGKASSKRSKKERSNVTNRRTRERFELPIPVDITGYDTSGNAWHEAVQSIDVSRAGASILLRRRVEAGRILYLRMPMPNVLRTHDYFDLAYGTYAIVRWVKPPQNGLRVVGVELIGELPPPGFLERPWATFQVNKWNGAERRKEPREDLAEAIEIEYYDESEQLIRRDPGAIENISPSGVRVCAQHPPEGVDLIRIIRPKTSYQVFAIVRNRFKGRDGFERLCAQFLNVDLPV